MIKSAIRDLRVSLDSRWLLAAPLQGAVQVWDLAARTRAANFKAIFSSGAAMLAIHPTGKFVFTGSSGSGKVAAYEVPGGGLLWQRKIGRMPRYLRCSPIGDYLWCTTNAGAGLERIDPNNGATLEALTDVSECFEGRYGYALLSGRAGRGDSPYRLRGEGREREVERTNLLLDASFAPDSLCLTEMTGPVRCIEYAHAKELWRYVPEGGSHVLDLHFSERARCYYGVLRHYQRGLYRRLLRFAEETGNVEVVCDLDSWADAFVPAAEQLVTSEGCLIDMRSGKTTARLDFPQREYPDSVEAWHRSREEKGKGSAGQ